MAISMDDKHTFALTTESTMELVERAAELLGMTSEEYIESAVYNNAIKVLKEPGKGLTTTH